MSAIAAEQALAASLLTAAQIAAFQENGYHIHGKLFTDEEVDALRRECERICMCEYETGIPPDARCWQPGGDSLAVRKIDNCWKSNRTVRSLVLKAEVGHVAAQLIGAPSIRLFHDQFLHKPPHGGKVVAWHQDWAYWQMIDRPETVTCWIALDDVRADSGPMVFLEGSHRLGVYSLPEMISGTDELKPRLPDGVKLREVPVIIQAGCVSFHHGLALHGSGRNTSPVPRRAIVAHTMSGACRYRPGQKHICETKMLEQPDCPQHGQYLAGPQFPQIWPSA